LKFFLLVALLSPVILVGGIFSLSKRLFGKGYEPREDSFLKYNPPEPIYPIYPGIPHMQVPESFPQLRIVGATPPQNKTPKVPRKDPSDNPILLSEGRRKKIQLIALIRRKRNRNQPHPTKPNGTKMVKRLQHKSASKK
jgi:hypothetical protein